MPLYKRLSSLNMLCDSDRVIRVTIANKKSKKVSLAKIMEMMQLLWMLLLSSLSFALCSSSEKVFYVKLIAYCTYD